MRGSLGSPRRTTSTPSFAVIDTSDLGNGTDLLLYSNGVYLDDLDSFFPYGASVNLLGSLFLNAGDTFDFIVGPNGTCSTCFYYDSVGFDATMTVPEPATLMLLGVGLAAAGVRRRMRKSA